jgi:ABC-type antimicrobial peptide transport system permease subunit
MTFRRLLLRNLLYHWRGNVAVFLGVVVGTAVLTGALLVGDSLRGSLRDLALRQLGWVDHALVSGRFVREKLADELSVQIACPAILLQGSASKDGTPRRAGRVTILGVDERFWPAGDAPLDREFWHPADPGEPNQSGIILNETLARELDVKVGDRVSLYLQKASDIPRETLLGRRGAGDVLDKLTLTVRLILPEDHAGARFSLNPSPESPRNAFVPLSTLQAHLDVRGRVNALFVKEHSNESAPNDDFSFSELAKKVLRMGRPRHESLRQLRLAKQQFLQLNLQLNLELDDWGLVLRDPATRARDLVRKVDPRSQDGSLSRARWRGRVPDDLAKRSGPDGRLTEQQIIAYYQQQHGYTSLESRQMLLDDFVAEAALDAAKDESIPAVPSLIYLADTISDGVHQIPYSVIAAIGPCYRVATKDAELPPPFGPLLPPAQSPLRDDEILLVDWPESPLTAKPGDPIKVTYYQLDQHSRLEKREATFTLRAKIPLTGPADDPDLTPEFRGITDKLDIRNWENPPFPYDPKRITPADEHYWNRYRTTPKAYITLAKGQELWGSRFGKLTTIRFDAKSFEQPEKLEEFRRRLRSNLDPAEGGLVFQPVRERSLLASAGGTDFDGLFLEFSFFLIVAALLLVGLLFRLNLDRRAEQIGILFAAGFRRLKVGLLLVLEGVVLAAAGAAAGCAVALFYAWLMLELLGRWWPSALDQSFLRLHATGQSLAIGFFASLLVSTLTIAVAVWLFARVPPRALLAGQTTRESDPTRPVSPPRWSVWIALSSLLLAFTLVAVGPFVHDHEARAGTFFGSGAFLLIAALSAVWAWMKRSRHATVSGQGLPALTRLGARNGARNPLRSILTAGLLASAAFLLVAVESFRRTSGADFLNKNAGSGGFALLAESDVPLFQDLQSDQGRQEILDALRSDLQQRGQDPRARIEAARTELQDLQFYPFRVHGGDDASCLNLYQPRRPRLLGVPSSLVERGGFQFAATEAQTEEERANPWKLLERQGGAIPVFGEANTVTWMLKSKLGGELDVPDERGGMRKLRIVGLLQDSVFQSGLLMSESNFLKLYPAQEGYNFFLIDTGNQPSAAIKGLLESALADRGFEVTPTAERLESYLAVENTYLSTFQALGGLGLLLGALGLAVVLLRSVWERRGELALLRALGYRHRALGWLVLAENGFLLLLGLAVGTVAALLSVAPHLVSGQGQVPVVRLLGLLLLVLVVGLASGALAVRATLRAPLIPALRRE